MGLAAVIGGVVSGIGSIAQGIAGKRASTYQAAVAENNAILANRAADEEIRAGAAEEEGQRLQTGAALGKAVAIQGASGLDVTGGSPGDVRASIADLGELDALTIRSNAARQAAQYRAQGANFKNDATLNRMQGRASLIAGFLGGAGSILGAVSSVSDRWAPYRAAPTFTPYAPAPVSAPLVKSRVNPYSYYPEFG